MSFDWTEETIRTLIAETGRYGSNDYIREHVAYLQTHLRMYRKYKSTQRADEGWERVVEEAQNVESWLKVLKAAESEKPSVEGEV